MGQGSQRECGRDTVGTSCWTEKPLDLFTSGSDALPNMYDENGVPTMGHEQAFWVRVKAPIKGGDGEQKAALAYASE